MACSSSLLMFKLENAESRNPLECLICDREFSSPIRLPCQHSYCRDCVQDRASCPVCGAPIEGELSPDALLEFLIDTSHEAADICANCDQISQPMHFCETCQQALCNECRQNTHQAKMFAAHRLVPLEERARVKGRVTCALHGEPYILYSMETRSLACIICFNSASLDSRHHLVHIDAAHKLACEKLEKAAVKLRDFQDDVREQLQLRKRLSAELAHSYRASCVNVRQTCQEMIDTLLGVRDRMLKELEESKAIRDQHFHEQMKHLTSLQPSLRLLLLSTSIFCSSASKLDFLQASTDLMKRIQALLSMECDKPEYTGELLVDSREEFSRALEPFLGLSSVLLSLGRNQKGEGVDHSGGSSSPRLHAYVKRSGSGYVNGQVSLSTKYQLVVDLAGAFGEQFARVETPLRQYSHEMTQLGKKVQEMQRDLTRRKCIIEKSSVDELIKKCVDLDMRVGKQSALISDLQPQLQQIWQEQLDRVRRQQVLFREKIEETISLRESARHVASAARQLEPFAVCLAEVTSVIDRRRCHPPDPAPMESICLQINTIEPDSQHRIEAIEKEEQNRRLAQDQKKREEQMKFASAKKHLKTTKEQKKLTREFTKDSASRPRIVNTTRDRSRGGTDRALLSPCHRRHNKGCSSVGSRSQSDLEDVESSMDDSFEFMAETSSAEVETVKVEREFCFCRSQPLRLSTPIPVISEKKESSDVGSASLPNDDHLCKRVKELNIGVDPKGSNQSGSCSGRASGSVVPKVPFVPVTIFAGMKPGMVTQGAWEVREKLLESLKQKVPRVDVGATKTPEREVPKKSAK